MITNLAPPVTFSVGFADSDVATCVSCYLAWRRRLQLTGFRNKQRALVGDLKDSLQRLLPLSTPYNRYLFVATDSNWTAVFSNDKNGSGCPEHISRLAVELGSITIHAGHIPHTLSRDEKTGYNGGTYIGINGPRDSAAGSLVRSVSAIYESGWGFDEWGKRLPFEQPDKYALRRKKDRFTPEMLDVYLRHYGIRLFDESFYLPESDSTAVLVY